MSTSIVARTTAKIPSKGIPTKKSNPINNKKILNPQEISKKVQNNKKNISEDSNIQTNEPHNFRNFILPTSDDIVDDTDEELKNKLDNSHSKVNNELIDNNDTKNLEKDNVLLLSQPIEEDNIDSIDTDINSNHEDKIIKKKGQNFANKKGILPFQVSKKIVTQSRRAGLTFPVGRIESKLKATILNKGRVSRSAPVYMAAVLEYLAVELIEISEQAANKRPKKKDQKGNNKITPLDILMAVNNDEDFLKNLEHVDMCGAGVYPKETFDLIEEENFKKHKKDFIKKNNAEIRKSNAYAKSVDKTNKAIAKNNKRKVQEEVIINETSKMKTTPIMKSENDLKKKQKQKKVVTIDNIPVVNEI